jgi:hypothetical protein
VRVSRAARLACVLGVTALAVAGALGAAGPAPAHASARATPAATTSSPVTNALLYGVAATSADNAWAVGLVDDDTGQSALLLHWNGRTWSRASIPTAAFGSLQAVTAVSAADAWALGYALTGTHMGVFILHWNGKTWGKVTNATVSNASFVTGAVAADAHDVWVSASNGKGVAEFLHLTGGRWHVVPASLPLDSYANSIAVVSPTLAWAAGYSTTSAKTFFERWNGSVWKQVADPVPGDSIMSMASGAGGAVWAVGTTPGNNPRFVSMRWDGRSWHVVKTPTTGQFYGVAFIPGGTAWAVGGRPAANLFIAHWTGRTWQQVAAAAPRYGSVAAVAATSASNAWAVGQYTPSHGTYPDPLILHWNGKAWS